MTVPYDFGQHACSSHQAARAGVPEDGRQCSSQPLNTCGGVSALEIGMGDDLTLPYEGLFAFSMLGKACPGVTAIADEDGIDLEQGGDDTLPWYEGPALLAATSSLGKACAARTLAAGPSRTSHSSDTAAEGAATGVHNLQGLPRAAVVTPQKVSRTSATPTVRSGFGSNRRGTVPSRAAAAAAAAVAAAATAAEPQWLVPASKRQRLEAAHAFQQPQQHQQHRQAAAPQARQNPLCRGSAGDQAAHPDAQACRQKSASAARKQRQLTLAEAFSCSLRSSSS